MAKYVVIRPWHGVSLGQVIERDTLHPALHAHVRPVGEGEAAETGTAEAKARAAQIIADAQAEADRIVADAQKEAALARFEAKTLTINPAGEVPPVPGNEQ